MHFKKTYFKLGFVLIFIFVAIIAFIWNKSLFTEDKVVEVIPDNIIGQDTLIIRLSDSAPQKFISSIYWSPFSSQMPIGDRYNPWIWNKDKQYFIFSVLSEKKVDYSEHIDAIKYLSDEQLRMGPQKQIIYLVDINSQEITPLLKLEPKEIYCINQMFYFENDSIYFRANKVYLIDIKQKSCIEVKK